MRKLLNTLYVFTEDVYLTLDGRNVVAKREGKEAGRVPLHTLESIQTFSYMGASPALMGACAEQGISLGFFDRRGRFLADIHGAQRGNVLLRKRQCLASVDQTESLEIARNFMAGKLFNSRWVLERSVRDHGMRIDSERVKAASTKLALSLENARASMTMDSLRGIEGDAAAVYFSVFDELLLRDKETFFFKERTRRPPTDSVNAMLSLFYTVLARDCSSALEAVGLDPYVGFMHVDRPGRRSLALDCMEELRPVMVDRFVVTAVNNRVVNASCFETRESGEVLLTDIGRKTLFKQWQERKKEQIVHPFLGEKIPWGLVPFVQAQLLSKCLRGDLDGYPPFMWK
jgi:CRISP-associated protein Cas1